MPLARQYTSAPLPHQRPIAQPIPARVVARARHRGTQKAAEPIVLFASRPLPSGRALMERARSTDL